MIHYVIIFLGFTNFTSGFYLGIRLFDAGWGLNQLFKVDEKHKIKNWRCNKNLYEMTKKHTGRILFESKEEKNN